jgi:hypothetical protein
VIGEAGPVAVMPPGLEVTTYVVIVEPPLFAGGVNVTVACALPAVALTAVGAPGVPIGAVGVTAFEGADGALVPTLLVAVTVNVYVVPLASPITVIGAPDPAAVIPPGEDVTV